MELDDIAINETEEIKPVDVLVELVKEKKIDPWEIDIVDLTEKYLDKVQEMGERNLRLSARTLLAASVLLRIKSDVVLSIERRYHDELDELNELDEIDEEFGDEESVNVSLAPKKIPLGINIQRKARRKVTLAELVNILDNIPISPQRSRRIKKAYRINKRDLVKFRSMKKDLRNYIDQMYVDIKEKLSKEECLPFSSMVDNSDRLTKARRFLYVLFLAHQNKVQVHQKAPFDEIFISVLNKESGK